MSTGSGDLPPFELAFPGPLRDRLVVAVLDGRKTTNTGLLAGYHHDGESLPEVGARSVLVDSDVRPVAVVEVRDVRVVRVADVPLAHAVAEGEGHRSVADWRAGHEEFWRSAEVRAELGAGFTVDDDTMVVLETFRVV